MQESLPKLSQCYRKGCLLLHIMGVMIDNYYITGNNYYTL